MGKYYEDRHRYEMALDSFERAEGQLAKVYGPTHPYIVSAIVKQGLCNARLSRPGPACNEYHRALALMSQLGASSHPMATDIEAYLASNCLDPVG